MLARQAGSPAGCSALLRFVGLVDYLQAFFKADGEGAGSSSGAPATPVPGDGSSVSTTTTTCVSTNTRAIVAATTTAAAAASPPPPPPASSSSSSSRPTSAREGLQGLSTALDQISRFASVADGLLSTLAELEDAPTTLALAEALGLPPDCVEGLV
jgi:hypothetical protein